MVDDGAMQPNIACLEASMTHNVCCSYSFRVAHRGSTAMEGVGLAGGFLARFMKALQEVMANQLQWWL